MVRNAIKSDFQSSKMAARGHFVKKKLGIDLKYREKRLKVIFGHQKRPPARNAIERDFQSSKMAARGHFVKKISKKN